LYHRQLKRFFELFPRERLLVLLYEDIQADPSAILARACAHVGVQVEEAAPVIQHQINDRNLPPIAGWARPIIAPLRPLMLPFQHTRWYGRARRWIGRRPQYPALAEDTWDRLRSYYEADVLELSRLLGRDLTMWLSRRGQD
jgi:hypothetical protein